MVEWTISYVIWFRFILFLNITTLCFWLNSSNKFDWFIPFIMVLYLVTPMYLDYLKNVKVRESYYLCFSNSVQFHIIYN